MLGLQQQRQQLEEQLMKEIKSFKESGVQYAKNESEYRKALRIEILQERAKGTPATIMSDVCRGKQDIAELKLNRDCSKTIHEASKEAIQVIKLRLRIVEEEINRQWNSGGRN